MTQNKGLMDATALIQQALEEHSVQLKDINHKIHSNPELGYEEFQAHDNIVSLLTSLGHNVIPHAYGIPTSFSVESGTGGRVVAFNAEYDALPGIGHACGHNLIAVASIASFLCVVRLLKEHNFLGRVRLIGTPAEEGGGGKLKLIGAGAYKDVDACLMIHPTPGDRQTGEGGQAYWTCLANHKFSVIYRGKAAHAAMSPWQGVNALDAVVLAYSGISALRQQMRPYERIHGVISEGGERPNIIPASGRLDYYVRSATLKEADELKARAMKCFEGAALATGCSVEYEVLNTYADLRPNRTICELYAAAMSDIGSPVTCDPNNNEAGSGSTDMGNVSYVCPSFHGVFGIPVTNGAFNHTPGFTAAAATDRAHHLALATAKGMAITAWKILTDDGVAAAVRKDFEEDKAGREREQERGDVIEELAGGGGGCC